MFTRCDGQTLLWVQHVPFQEGTGKLQVRGMEVGKRGVPQAGVGMGGAGGYCETQPELYNPLPSLAFLGLSFPRESHQTRSGC